MTGTLQGRAIPTRDVEHPDGGTFAVRGIGLNDALSIYDRHRGVMSDWFDQLAAKGNGEPGVSLDQMSGIAQGVMSGSPQLAAEIIAAGSGSLDDESVALAGLLPLGPSLAALTAIGEMTFSREMPPKKFFETVIRAAQGMLPGTAAPAA